MCPSLSDALSPLPPCLLRSWSPCFLRRWPPSFGTPVLSSRVLRVCVRGRRDACCSACRVAGGVLNIQPLLRPSTENQNCWSNTPCQCWRDQAWHQLEVCTSRHRLRCGNGVLTSVLLDPNHGCQCCTLCQCMSFCLIVSKNSGMATTPLIVCSSVPPACLQMKR